MSPLTVEEALEAFGSDPRVDQARRAMDPAYSAFDVCLVDTADRDTVSIHTITAVGAGRTLRILPLAGGTRMVTCALQASAVAASLGFGAEWAAFMDRLEMRFRVFA